MRVRPGNETHGKAGQSLKKRFIHFTAVFDGIQLEDDELSEVWAEANAATRKEGGLMVPVIGYGLPVIFANIATLTGIFVPPPLNLGLFGQVLIGIMTGVVLWAIYLWIYHNTTTYPVLMRHIRAAMKKRGYSLCEQCGYHLTGHGEGEVTCPECGKVTGPTPT